jgi:MoaA/NifB/PqqE/SkfB family radical SAM enzyme
MTAGDLRKADELRRNFAGKAMKSACYAPFVSLYLTPTGHVQACCRNNTFVLGNVQDHRLTEIWSGSRIGSLRKALTEYKFNLGCGYCEWEGLRGLDSFAIRLMSDQYPVDSQTPEWPAVIEFNGSNICNLECVMCAGEYSSAIRGNVEGLPPMARVYNNQFFEDLRPFLRHLRFFNFLGGEPFLTPEAYRIWDMMIEDHLLIPCRVTTNGTQFNAKMERVLDAIPTHITVSLDGVTKETYEGIRRRAHFEEVMRNLQRFHRYTRERGMNFGISFCLQRQNWQEMADMMLFAEDLDCELSIVLAIWPSRCSLFTLPPEELRAIVEAIETRGASMLAKLRRHRGAWDETLQQLRAATEAPTIAKIENVMSLQLQSEDPITRATKLMDEGDYEKALRRLDGVRETYPYRYQLLALSGYLRSRLGQFEAADKDLSAALQLSKKLPDAYLYRGRILLQQGKIDGALENAALAAERVMPEDSFDAPVHILLAFIYARRWQLLQAYRACARLASLPQASRQGIAMPDSRQGAGAIARELTNGGAPVAARRVCTLSKLAIAARNFNRRFRGFKFQPIPVLRGDAVQSLIPPNSKEAARWNLRVAGVGNRAQLTLPDRPEDSIRVVIAEFGGSVSHDVQLNYGGLSLMASHAYRLQFRVRAAAPRTVRFGVAKGNPPWSNIGLYEILTVGADWQDVQAQVAPESTEPNARIHFDLGESDVTFEIAGMSVADLGESKKSPGNPLVVLGQA